MCTQEQTTIRGQRVFIRDIVCRQTELRVEHNRNLPILALSKLAYTEIINNRGPTTTEYKRVTNTHVNVS